MPLDQLPPIGAEIPETFGTLPPIGAEVQQTPQSAPKTKGEVIYRNAPQTTPEMIGSFAMGALKQPGRLVQMVPGVAALTDKMYGLEPGSSAKEMEPKNTAEQVGGYAADAAEMVGAGLADAGMVYTRNAVGQFTKAPFMQSVGGRAGQIAGDVSQGAIQAVKANLGVGGPVTAAKVGDMIGRYGVKAVKLGLQGAIGVTAARVLWDTLGK